MSSGQNARPGTVLVVDDDTGTRSQIAWALEGEHRVVEAGDATQAEDALAGTEMDVVLLDLHLPPAVTTPAEGLRLLDRIRARPSPPAVIVMTGDRDHRTALDCVARGAVDFFEKPLPLAELRLVVARALRVVRLEREVARLERALAEPDARTRLVGRSSVMLEVARLVERVADTPATVLLRGESGTGKALVARALHDLSARRAQPFVVLDCAALPATLVEDELFGHERGAFTGAHVRRVGRFERAHLGTLFLDEIGELPQAVQAKLLRVVQEGEVERIGGTEPIRVDVRLVAATRLDLEARVRAGQFRDDLYYRLAVVQVPIPSLRQRREDVPLLVQHFLQKHGGGKVRRASDAALALLVEHDWPGNVRELEHAVVAGVTLCTGEVLQPEDLPPALRAHVAATRIVQLPPAGTSLRDVERDLVVQALERSGWNQSQAARLLQVSRPVLMQRMKRHGLRPPVQPGPAGS